MIPNSTIAKFVQKNLVYISEDQRRRTFKKWIYSDRQPCNAGKKVEAGFIFIGDEDAPDAVFLCEKPFRVEIQRIILRQDYSADCSFATFQKAEDSLSLRKFLNIKDELAKKSITIL